MTTIMLDGIRYTVPDEDIVEYADEVVKTPIRNTGTTEIVNTSELGDALKHLNDDSMEAETRMSGIDMKARLHFMEITSVLALDALVALGVCPPQCLAFTRQKKRLSVSEAGKGREEIVQIVAGKQEQDVKKSMGGIGQRMSNFITGPPKV